MKRDLPNADQIIEASEATWPPASVRRVGAWLIRDGAGGGKRASGRDGKLANDEADLPVAEKEMRALGMDPLFQIRHGDEHLDDMLEKHGYRIIDPVNFWVIHVDELAKDAPPPVSAFCVWPTLSIMEELWEKGGVGPGRRAVMARADCPKTALLARTDDKPSGVGYVGIHGDIAMVHALHVDQAMRRQGTGQHLMKQAAIWAKEQGAKYVALIVTQGNHAANPLYANMGMHLVGHYHYRTKP